MAEAGSARSVGMADERLAANTWMLYDLCRASSADVRQSLCIDLDDLEALHLEVSLTWPVVHRVRLVHRASCER